MTVPSSSLERKPEKSSVPREPDPYGRSRREVELRKLIPNMMTGGAFCCGLASIYFSLKYNPGVASAAGASGVGLWSSDKVLATAIGLIGMSFLLDGFDGRMARLLKVSSRFGEKFDSIADFVSFGVAPAFVLFKWKLQQGDELGYGVAVLYALCAAIRLARFTAQAKKKSISAPVSRFFTGLPAPAAAFVVLIPAMLALSDVFNRWSTIDWSSGWILWIVVVFTLVVAGLMVSTIPMASVKHVRIDRKLVPFVLLGVGVIAVCMIKDTWLTLSTMATLYMLSIPMSVFRARKIGPAT